MLVCLSTHTCLRYSHFPAAFPKGLKACMPKKRKYCSKLEYDGSLREAMSWYLEKSHTRHKKVDFVHLRTHRTILSEPKCCISPGDVYDLSDLLPAGVDQRPEANSTSIRSVNMLDATLFPKAELLAATSLDQVVSDLEELCGRTKNDRHTVSRAKNLQ